MTYGRTPRPVHVGRGVYVHPTTARWLGLQRKPPRTKLTVRDLIMARQPKTAKPKAKFARGCLTCGVLPTRDVKAGRLVTTFPCEHNGQAPSTAGAR